MKLPYVALSLALTALLSLNTACNDAQFQGKSGLSGNENTAPTEIPPASPPPPVEPTTPGPIPAGPATPTVENPDTDNPATDPTDPDCLNKGTCEVPCDQTKVQCPTVPEECTVSGVNCPDQDPDSPGQNDDPGQH